MHGQKIHPVGISRYLASNKRMNGKTPVRRNTLCKIIQRASFSDMLEYGCVDHKIIAIRIKFFGSYRMDRGWTISVIVEKVSTKEPLQLNTERCISSAPVQPRSLCNYIRDTKEMKH
jgi:hypothetical protein